MVPSACETGRGELAAGEGFLGLSRALTLAGARGFKLSLWKVPDLETRALMDAFYDVLWSGPTPAAAEDALRAAQLACLAPDRAAGRSRAAGPRGSLPGDARARPPVQPRTIDPAPPPFFLAPGPPPS